MSQERSWMMTTGVRGKMESEVCERRGEEKSEKQVRNEKKRLLESIV